MDIRLGDVDTWYDEHGEGEALVLLHPGGADSRVWEVNLPPLAARFHVFTPESTSRISRSRRSPPATSRA